MSDYIHANKVVYLTQYHLIWCPKYRRDILVNSIKDRLEEIIKNVCAERQMKIKALEIMPNHVHLFVSISYQHAPFKIAHWVKGRSSNLLRKEFPELRKMPTLWSRSFFLASIGNVSGKTIKRYIEDQWKKK